MRGRGREACCLGDDHDEGHKAGKDGGHGQAGHNRYRLRPSGTTGFGKPVVR